ncbi:hypothetical protein GCM10011378_08060 [Hymenobacter glacieicola]|uniref:TFIIB-type domain-containing protein n=2 Tax=Hymenobacter glacieicola TaxID=1562124 RepID=A0ABQ1WJW0_9BACT|nr:hypothetical protein GCM10011378_08060 [Hymenobacter glacieicola]
MSIIDIELDEEMEMPCPCQHCGEWFDLHDGRSSKSWYPGTVICKECRDEEREEMEAEAAEDEEEDEYEEEDPDDFNPDACPECGSDEAGAVICSECGHILVDDDD